jgi:hypothetical protein
MTISCEALSDRMPAVARGQAEWTEAEAAHVSACPNCGAEWRLVQRAARLGVRDGEAIAPARVAGAVLARLRAERRRRWIRTGWLAALAAAAAVVLLVWSGRQGRPGVEPGAAPAEFHLPMAELDGLDQQQLQTVLDDLEGPLGGTAASEVPSLGDLDDHQLERVLRSLEG